MVTLSDLTIVPYRVYETTRIFESDEPVLFSILDWIECNSSFIPLPKFEYIRSNAALDHGRGIKLSKTYCEKLRDVSNFGAVDFKTARRFTDKIIPHGEIAYWWDAGNKSSSDNCLVIQFVPEPYSKYKEKMAAIKSAIAPKKYFVRAGQRIRESDSPELFDLMLEIRAAYFDAFNPHSCPIFFTDSTTTKIKLTDDYRNWWTYSRKDPEVVQATESLNSSNWPFVIEHGVSLPGNNEIVGMTIKAKDSKATTDGDPAEDENTFTPIPPMPPVSASKRFSNLIAEYGKQLDEIVKANSSKDYAKAGKLYMLLEHLKQCEAISADLADTESKE